MIHGSGRDLRRADDDPMDCRSRSPPTTVDDVLASREHPLPLKSRRNADRSVVAGFSGRHGLCRSP
jgi:hypothetical protein